MKKAAAYIIILVIILTGAYGVFAAPAEAELISWVENKVVESVGAQIGNTILTLMSKVVFITGLLLNSAITHTMNISGLVASIPAIELAWKTVRDVSTMFLIFILLWAAIGTIIDHGPIRKDVLPSIIIAGLLINFSMFFTKVIIDASNVAAVGFYNAITAPAKEAIKNNTDYSVGGSLSVMDGGISAIFMDSLRIQTVYDSASLKSQGAELSGGTLLKTNLNGINIIISTVLGSVVMLIAAFVFLVAACMFIVRTGLLIFLMALSPAMFVGMIIKNASGFQKMWWDWLINQSIFAPAYLALTYVALKIITDPSFNRALNGGGQPATFAEAFIGQGSVAIIFNYALVIFFLMAALFVAKTFGGKSAEYGLKAAGMVRGWALKNTVGRGARFANRYLDRAKESMEESKLGRIALGTLKYTTLGAASGVKRGIEMAEETKFDGHESVKGTAEQRKKEVESGIRDRRDDPQRLARYMMGLSRAERAHAYEKLSARDRAEVATHLPRDEAERLRLGLNTEEQEKTQTAAREAGQRRENAERRNRIHNAVIGGTPIPVGDITAIPVSDARRLSHESRMDPTVIQNLSVRHLGDLMANGDLTPDEIQAIRTHATPAQNAWMNDPSRAALWTP